MKKQIITKYRKINSKPTIIFTLNITMNINIIKLHNNVTLGNSITPGNILIHPEHWICGNMWHFNHDDCSNMLRVKMWNLWWFGKFVMVWSSYCCWILLVNIMLKCRSRVNMIKWYFWITVPKIEIGSSVFQYLYKNSR